MSISRTNVAPTDPMVKGAAITPHDTNTFPLTRELYFAGVGNVKVTWADGTEATHAVTAGSVRFWSVYKVWSTGTTATGIEAFW